MHQVTTPGWEVSPLKVTPQTFAKIHIYSWVKRGTVRFIKYPAQEHNTVTPPRAWNWTSHSRVQFTASHFLVQSQLQQLFIPNCFSNISYLYSGQIQCFKSQLNQPDSCTCSYMHLWCSCVISFNQSKQKYFCFVQSGAKPIAACELMFPFFPHDFHQLSIFLP